MYAKFSRRYFMATSAAGGVVIVALGAPARLLAMENLVGVTWGGLWIDATRPIAEDWGKRHDARITWELHEGSSITVATKIRATWPNVRFDIISGNDPLFHICIKEGWLESVNDLPNIKDIPKEFIMRDPEGRAVSVPKSIDSVTWGYRTDLIRDPITSLSQLLEPRFKAKIVLRAPVSYQGLQLVSAALERGGDEKNMDPGLAFFTELAKTGNVSLVAKSGVDNVNAINSGEAAIGFLSSAEWARVTKNHPVKILGKVEGSRSLKCYYGLLHWGVPHGRRAALAKDFCNAFVGPENNEKYNAQINGAPVNVKSKTSAELTDYYAPAREISKYVYFPDWAIMSEKGSDWIQRFDLEIRPLLKV
jgi:putative spermidine/putrescine transport system substrate-binding protein